MGMKHKKVKHKHVVDRFPNIGRNKFRWEAYVALSVVS